MAKANKQLTRRQLVWRRFLRLPGTYLGGGILLILVLLAIFVPIFYPHSPYDHDFVNLLSVPSRDHWFGTNSQGQDYFIQIVQGLRISLIIGFSVAIFTTVISVFFGTVAGFFGGKIDKSIVYFITLMLVFPSFILLLAFAPIFQQAHWLFLVPLLVIFSWMLTSRVIRAITMGLVNMEFVQAARFMGVHPMLIITRHIIPNISSWMIIDTTLSVSGAILTETGLSFLGFGILYPNFSLGSVLQTYNTSYPHTWVFSAGVLAILIIAVNMLGEALRDALDPTSGRGHSNA